MSGLLSVSAMSQDKKLNNIIKDSIILNGVHQTIINHNYPANKKYRIARLNSSCKQLNLKINSFFRLLASKNDKNWIPESEIESITVSNQQDIDRTARNCESQLAIWIRAHDLLSEGNLEQSLVAIRKLEIAHARSLLPTLAQAELVTLSGNPQERVKALNLAHVLAPGKVFISEQLICERPTLNPELVRLTTAEALLEDLTIHSANQLISQLELSSLSCAPNTDPATAKRRDDLVVRAEARLRDLFNRNPSAISYALISILNLQCATNLGNTENFRSRLACDEVINLTTTFDLKSSNFPIITQKWQDWKSISRTIAVTQQAFIWSHSNEIEKVNASLNKITAKDLSLLKPIHAPTIALLVQLATWSDFYLNGSLKGDNFKRASDWTLQLVRVFTEANSSGSYDTLESLQFINTAHNLLLRASTSEMYNEAMERLYLFKLNFAHNSTPLGEDKRNLKILEYLTNQLLIHGHKLEAEYVLDALAVFRQLSDFSKLYGANPIHSNFQEKFVKLGILIYSFCQINERDEITITGAISNSIKSLNPHSLDAMGISADFSRKDLIFFAAVLDLTNKNFNSKDYVKKLVNIFPKNELNCVETDDLSRDDFFFLLAAAIAIKSEDASFGKVLSMFIDFEEKSLECRKVNNLSKSPQMNATVLKKILSFGPKKDPTTEEIVAKLKNYLDREKISNSTARDDEFNEPGIELRSSIGVSLFFYVKEERIESKRLEGGGSELIFIIQRPSLAIDIRNMKIMSKLIVAN
jgi:hypothetical protein